MKIQAGNILAQGPKGKARESHGLGKSKRCLLAWLDGYIKKYVHYFAIEMSVTRALPKPTAIFKQ